MENPKAVIFDFDGVLVDSLPLHLKGWRLASKRLFGKAPPDLSEFVGRATNQISLGIVKLLGEDEDQSRPLAKVKEQIVDELLVADIFFPKVSQVLKSLDEKKIPYGIATNATRDFITKALSKVPFEFAAVATRDDVKRTKPHPDVFLLCASRLGIPFYEHGAILALDDSAHGIKAAATAGMFAVGVNTANQRQKLIDSGAKEVIANVEETSHFLTKDF